jgi:RNA polymerase sigma-70 factor (ECF subfamily)
MPSFEEIMLPHLPSAYNLARWILRNDHDAEDSVQDAFVRAFRAFDRFRGGDGRAWLLTIVRNVCYSRLRDARGELSVEEFDEATHGVTRDRAEMADRVRREAGAELLEQALDALPAAMREIIVLHEIEGLSYREIASVAGIPIGTVMSRLARARERLHGELIARLEKEKEAPHGL